MAEFQIIKKLGGLDDVCEVIRNRCGYATNEAVRLWLKRGRISSDGMTALMAECDDRGISYTSSDFEARE
jgi:hypothetical protein